MNATRNIRTAALYAIIAILVAACAALGYYAFSESYALSLLQLYGLNSALSMRYGTVVSVDATASTITINMYHTPDSAYEPVLFQVSPHALIEYETLTAEPGASAYDGISQPQPASLSDIQPGVHVAILGQSNGDSLVAEQILFGNPL